MWKLAVNRDSLSQFGFVYDNKEKKFIYETDPDGGGVFINDEEDYFRVDQYCFETLDGKDDTYIPEHIATLDDEWKMERFVELGVTIYVDVRKD